MNDPFVNAGMGLLVWLLFSMILATFGEQKEKSFFYPGKREGEKGVITTCRWSFIIAFSPLICSLLILYLVLILLVGLAKHSPTGLVKLYEWMKEEG